MKNRGTGGSMKARGLLAAVSLLTLVAGAGFPPPAAAMELESLDRVVRNARCSDVVVYEFRNASVLLKLNRFESRKYDAFAVLCSPAERKVLGSAARESDKLVLPFAAPLPTGPRCLPLDEKGSAALNDAVRAAFERTPDPCRGPLVAGLDVPGKLL